MFRFFNKIALFSSLSIALLTAWYLVAMNSHIHIYAKRIMRISIPSGKSFIYYDIIIRWYHKTHSNFALSLNNPQVNLHEYWTAFNAYYKFTFVLVKVARCVYQDTRGKSFTKITRQIEIRREKQSVLNWLKNTPAKHNARISESSSMKYFPHVPKYYVYFLLNQRKYLMSVARFHIYR